MFRNAAKRYSAIPLTYEQFRYGFANAVGVHETQALYENFAPRGAAQPLGMNRSTPQFRIKKLGIERPGI